MKRTLAIAVLVIVAACGGGDDDETAAEPEPVQTTQSPKPVKSKNPLATEMNKLGCKEMREEVGDVNKITSKVADGTAVPDDALPSLKDAVDDMGKVASYTTGAVEAGALDLARVYGRMRVALINEDIDMLQAQVTALNALLPRLNTTCESIGE